MKFIIICAVSLSVSGLTFFSGFGLGTLLMPVFALFFPLSTAIAATAIVHLANNIFKVILIGKKADRGTVLRFALPGAAAAFIGAYLLSYLDKMEPLLTYTLGGRACGVTVIKIVIGTLIVASALYDIIPAFARVSFDKKFISLGGAVSGLFGGLSGHQGAFRAAFLTKCGLDKEAFIGTSVVSAVIVDFSRLLVYGYAFYNNLFMSVSRDLTWLVSAACISAFIGAFFGRLLLKKMRFQTVRRIIAVMLVALGTAIAIGLI